MLLLTIIVIIYHYLKMFNGKLYKCHSTREGNLEADC